MKNKIGTIANVLTAISIVLLSASCSNNNSENEELKGQVEALQSQLNEMQQTKTTEPSSNLIEDIIVDSIMDGYETQNRITDLNSLAASIKNETDAFLTVMDTQGIGMLREGNNIQIIDVTVEDYIWKVSATNSSVFNSTDKMVWGQEGIGHKNDNKSSASNAETLLAIDFAQVFTDLENAAVKIILVSGRCRGVAITLDINTPLQEGIECPSIVDGEFDTSFRGGVLDGKTENGLIVGTAPMVKSK